MERPTDAMRRKLAEQHDEIAWLKERLEESEHGRSVAWDRVRFAERERDELRELVHVMAYCMQEFRDCDGCAINGADGVVTAPSGCDWLRDRMRELGVVE